MKKLFTIALSLVLTCSLAACGCQAQEPAPTTTVPTTNAPTTTATTAPTTTATVPSMDPTIDTNIPDAEVESNSTEVTEGTGGAGESIGENGNNEGGQSDSTDMAGESSRMRR